MTKPNQQTMRISDLPANQLLLTACAATGLVANWLSLSSCRLMEFEGGSLGLYKYAHDGFDHCSSFGFNMEDEGFQVARIASASAVGFGSCLLVWNVINLYLPRIQASQDIISMLLGGATQVCLSMVYVARQNEVCDMYECKWGRSILWNLLAHVMYLAASTSPEIFGMIASKQPPEGQIRKRKKRRMLAP